MRAGAATRRALAEAADRTLLLDATGNTLTGAELDERIAKLAGYLAEGGLQRGRIGLAYRNSFAAVEAFHAVEWLGATRVPVDPELPAAEMRSVFKAAEVDAILTDHEHAAKLGGDVLVHDDGQPLGGERWREEVEIPGDSPFMIYPRSVADGELFGITFSHRNWQAVMDLNCKLFREGWYGPPIGEDDLLVTTQQLMHGTGMVASFPFLLLGLPQVVLPRFHAETLLEIIERHRVTTTFAVPGMLTRLADELDKRDRAALAAPLPLRRTLYGGAPLTPAELRRVLARVGGSLVQLYGRFEGGWPLAVLGQAEHARIAEGDDELATSCGRPIPHVETRLADISGRPDGYGELQTRSAMVVSQYADPDGWCSLGDIAYPDARGYLHLAGRLDDMINTGSYHVYPQQIVEAIEEVPGVVQARVTGEPDPVWGQAVTAYIVAENPDGWDDLLEAVDGHLHNRLAKYKVPKTYQRVDRLD